MLRKTSVPLIVSPWLYKACKYNYGFSLWHCLSKELRARHFSHTENHTLDVLNFILGAFKKIYSVGKKMNLTCIGRKPYKTNTSCNVCVYSLFTKH